MSQIIQMLQNGTDDEKGLLLRQVKARLETKDRATLPPLERDLIDLINWDTLSATSRGDLASNLSKITLLSDGVTNPKTAKDAGLVDFANVILHLSPSDLSGVNVCPMASRGCRAACLNGAGRGLFDGVQLPRLRKTLYFLKMRKEFMSHIDKEIGKIYAKTKGRTIVRLNGTSDIAWENFSIRDGKNIFELYKNVTFYDYTKVYPRLKRIKTIPNYHITFSANESNWDDCLKALAIGINVATVFRSATLPELFQGFKVLDGDAHDFRFLDLRHDSKGYVVGLKAKGPAKRDQTGFVKDVH